LGSRKRQRGAAALEFAIVLPVLILLLVGIVDFGMVMGAQSQVANAAREGARAGALTGSQSQAISAATNGISDMPGATNSGTNVTVACTTVSGTACSLTDTTPDTGSTITVTVTYVHTWLSPVMLGFSPTITLQGKSQMRIEA
jgi:Flp pilus assembly protein TadG